MSDEIADVQKLNDLLGDSRELNEELRRLGVERLKTLKDHSELSSELKGIIENQIAQEKALSGSLSDRLQMARDYLDAVKETNIVGYQGQLTQEASLEVQKLELDLAKEDLKLRRQRGEISGIELADLINKIKKEEDEYNNQKRLVEERKKAKDEIKKSIPLVGRLATATSDMLDDLQKGNADMAIKLMGEAAETVRESFKKVGSQITGGFEFSLQGLLTRMLELGVELDSIQQEFRRATMLNESFADSLEDTAAATAKFGVTMKEAAEAQMSLVKNVTDFTLATREQRDELIKTAAVMSELGVQTQDFAQGVQASIKFFGQSMTEAEATQRELMATARELQVIPGELSSQFAKMSGSLAKLGSDGVGAFKELARVSKITGMEMEKILQITDKFDTFEGAAEQVGKINAALGGNFVNAMDLMMDTDPASRFEKIREAITGAGLSFDSMSYYQRKFFADSLGLANVGDLALMLSGNMSTMEGATQKTAAEYEQMAKEAAALQTVQDQFNSTLAAFFMENKDAIMDFITNIRDLFQTVLDNIDTITTLVKSFLFLKTAMFALSILLPAVKLGMIAYAAITGTTTAATTAQTVAQFGLAAGFQVADKSGKRAIGTMVILAGAFALIAAAMLIASPSKLVIALFGFAAAVFALGRMSESSAAQIQALAIPMLQLGIAIGIASAGLGFMADAFGRMDAVQALGMANAILALAIAIDFLTPSLGVLAAGFKALAKGPVAIGIGLFIALLLAIAVTAAAIGYMAEGFANLFGAIDVGKIVPFNIFMNTLAALVPVYFVAATGLKAISLGITAFGTALNFVDSERLRSIADFSMGLAGIQTESLAQLAIMLEKVAEAMEGIPESKAVALTATMQAASIAAEAAESLAGKGKTGGGGGKGGGGARAGRSQPFEVKFILDGEVFERKVVRVFEMENGKFHAEAGRNER